MIDTMETLSTARLDAGAAAPRVRSAPPYRSALTVGRLPFSLKWQVAAAALKSRTLRGAALKLAKYWIGLIHHRARLPLTGEVRIGSGDTAKAVPFNGRNTHFASLYMAADTLGYEAETVALLDGLLGETGVLYDVGSNFGYFALNMAARPGFKGQVQAFEPHPSAFEDLANLTRRAGLTETIECHRLALSDEDGTGYLAKLSGDKRGAEVPRARLDSLSLPPPDVIKIDVEGHELEVLKGAEVLLQTHRPVVIFESLRGGPLGKTFEPFTYLAELGYVFFVPAWYMEDDHDWMFDRVPTAESLADQSFRLGLIPYYQEARFLLNDNLNVCAWPSDRLADLDHLFDKQIRGKKLT